MEFISLSQPAPPSSSRGGQNLGIGHPTPPLHPALQAVLGAP